MFVWLLVCLFSICLVACLFVRSFVCLFVGLVGGCWCGWPEFNCGPSACPACPPQLGGNSIRDLVLVQDFRRGRPGIQCAWSLEMCTLPVGSLSFLHAGAPWKGLEPLRIPHNCIHSLCVWEGEDSLGGLPNHTFPRMKVPPLVFSKVSRFGQNGKLFDHIVVKTENLLTKTEFLWKIKIFLKLSDLYTF